MHEGRIVERGTHESLLADGGVCAGVLEGVFATSLITRTD
jgi:hypothetical protein